MTQSPGTWSYRPGTWLGIVGAASTLLLPAGEKRRAADLWSRIDDGDDFDTVLDALLQTGLGALPAFVLIGTDAAAGTTRLLVRGDAVHASAQTADGPVEVEGPAGRTWVEQTLEGVTALQVEVEPAEDGAGEVDDLTIVDGLVRVSRVGFPAGAGATGVAAPADAAGSTDALGSTGPSWAAAAPVALPVAGDTAPEPDLPLVPSDPEPDPVADEPVADEPVADEPSEAVPAAAYPPPPAYPPPAPAAPASPSAWPTSSPGSAWPTPPPPPAPMSEPVSEPLSDTDPPPTELLDLDSVDDQPDDQLDATEAGSSSADALDPYPDEEPTGGFGGFAAFESTDPAAPTADTGSDTGADTDPQAETTGALDDPAGVGFFGQAPPAPPADPVEPVEPVRDEESSAPAWAAGLDLPPPPSPEEAAAQPAFEPEPAPSAPPAPPPYGDHDGLTQAGAVSSDPGRPAVGIPGQSPAPGSLDEPVARLVLSHGENIDVDRVVLIGRAPEARRFTTTDQPLLVTVPSPLHEISSTHVEIRPGTGVDHGSAVVTDMGSTNGTVLVQPGLGPEDLVPGIAVQLIPGATINLGDGVTISVARP